jgi:O-antigen/teichoic acid export membrane protein
MLKSKFISRIYKLLKIPMFKNLLVLVSGTGIAQIFPILSAPIVARLYEPQDFGIYAIFYSLVTVFTGFSFLEYNNIVIVAPSNQKAYEGMILSTLITFTINFFLFLLIILIPKTFLVELFGKEMVPFLWVVPITVFFNTMNLLFYTWFLRKGNYKLLSKNKIILAVCSVVLQIGIGFLYIGTTGFVIANLISILISLVLLIYSFNVNKEFVGDSVNINSLKLVAYEYRKFALVSVWGNTLNIFTLQIPQFLLNKVFGAQVLGQYSLAQRMISLPLGFVSSAIQDVFRQGAAEEEIEIGNCKKTYLNTLKIGSVVAVVILLSCLTFVPPLFVFVFGSKWADAGIYVKVLSLLFVVRFVVAPLSYTLYIKAKQHIDFMWQVGLFVLSVLTLYGGYYWFGIEDPINLLFLYSICLTFWYLLNLCITYKLSKKIND